MKNALDQLDLKILQCLQKNAKTTNQDLAEQVGLSPSSCLQRVRRIEERGYINRYLAIINLPRLCRTLTCIATVTLRQHSREDFDNFERRVQKIPEVIECYTVSGGCDFILKTVCADMTRYLQLNDELVSGSANIENINTHVVMSENKPFSGYPLNSLVERND